MSVVFPLLLGIVQGITEFLPVSSSGHLALLQAFFGREALLGSVTAFSLMLHAGTLLAVFVIYKKDCLALLRALGGTAADLLGNKGLCTSRCGEERRTLLFLAAGTLPLVFLKLTDLLSEHTAGRSLIALMDEKLAGDPAAVGLILIFNGFLLLLGERRKSGDRPLDLRAALLIGVFQMFAVLPGLSRSGATIAAGRLWGLRREEAVRFSFLLSIPAVLGSLITELPSLARASAPSPGQTAICLTAALVSFVTGLLCMKLLSYIARKGNFKGFAYYCFALGAAALIVKAIGYFR